VNWACCALLFLSGVEVIFAAPGRIKIRDGSILTGEITIDPNLGLVITNSEIGATNFAIADVALAQFITEPPAGSQPAATAADGSTLPRGWTNTDIGPFTLAGSTRAEDGVYIIGSSGSAIWLPQPDEFHFMYRAFKGNGQFVAQVTNVQAAVAGIMFRETLAPDSEFVLVGLAPTQGGLIFRSRRDLRQRELTHMQGDWHNREDENLPSWLKVTRHDKRFIAYRSLDEGITWEPFYATPSEWEQPVYAGLFVVGGFSNQLKRASFANVFVEDEADALKTPTNKMFKVQVTLNDGTILNADTVSADQSRVRIRFGGTNFSTSIYTVARLAYGVVPERLKRELTNGRKGVLLKSGDFFEGELRSVDQNQLKMSSVLFGQRTFQTERVLVVTISTMKEVPAPFQVKTRNGSAIQARTLVPATDSLIAEEARLGRIVIPLAQLGELMNDSLNGK